MFRRFGENIEVHTTRTLTDILTVLGFGGSSATESVVEIVDVLATPPGGPAVGSKYLVDCNATGVWAGQDGNIAEWNGLIWVFTAAGFDKIYFNRATGIGYTSNDALGITTTVDYNFFYHNKYGHWQDNILDQLDTPPGGPADKDRYLVIAVATGAWVGQEGKIATNYCGTWIFTDPAPGQLIYDENLEQYLEYNSTLVDWNPYVPGIPGSTFNITGPLQAKDVLIHDGADFIDRQLTIEDLANITFPPIAGQVLTALTPTTYDWQTPAGGGGATDLDGLTDVTITAPVVAHVLRNNGAGQFVNTLLDTHDLSDVDAVVPTSGQALVYDGATYTPETVLTAAEQLTTLRGRVLGAGGTIDVGSGFAVFKISTGRYRMDFTTSFSTKAVAVASISNASGGSNDRVIRTANAATTSFEVLILTTAGSAVDDDFSFIAVGTP